MFSFLLGIFALFLMVVGIAMIAHAMGFIVVLVGYISLPVAIVLALLIIFGGIILFFGVRLACRLLDEMQTPL